MVVWQLEGVAAGGGGNNWYVYWECGLSMSTSLQFTVLLRMCGVHSRVSAEGRLSLHTLVSASTAVDWYKNCTYSGTNMERRGISRLGPFLVCRFGRLGSLALEVGFRPFLQFVGSLKLHCSSAGLKGRR